MQVAVVLVALLVAGCEESSRPSTTTRQDLGEGYRVSYPEGWRLAGHTVDSQVTNPRELLVVSTFELPEPGEHCGPFYDDVLDHMAARDGLVAVRERLGKEVAGPPTFPERPAQFQLEPSKPERGGCGLGAHRGFQRWWIPFEDAGRDFYAQVALGRDAPEALRHEAARILDSLRFDD
jgi:hypothetical protein